MTTTTTARRTFRAYAEQPCIDALAAITDAHGQLLPGINDNSPQVGILTRARFDASWSGFTTEGFVPTDPATADWTTTGEKVVPVNRRPAFLAMLAGQDWRSPEGSGPMSPVMAINAFVAEFGIRPVESVSHNLPWYAPDGPETATYSIIGVRTRKQRLIAVDEGWRIVPVVILPA